MTAPVFVDTNVLIYAVDEGNHAKQEAAKNWRTVLWKSGAGRLSFQVLQEFYAKVTHRWPNVRVQARQEVSDLLAWQPVVIGEEVIALAWKAQDRFGFSFWDAMIVAAAKVASCQYLLTEDLQPGQDLDGILVISPFLSTPQSLVDAKA